MSHHLSPEQWSDLCDAIRDNECVLLLGPKAATYDGDFLVDLLAKKIAKILQRDYGLAAEQCPQKLPELIQLYENRRVQSLLDKKNNAIIKSNGCNYSTPATSEVAKVLKSFYEGISGDDIPIYKTVAELPFSCIITTTPDDLLKKALEANDRNPHCFFFNFNNAKHNNIIDDKDALKLDNINHTQPFLYNLMGNYQQFNSLVLTDDNRLKFIEKVLQRDKGSIPANIAIHFADPKIKYYLFAGFDFNDWHLRLLMHFFRLNPHLSQNNDYQSNIIVRENFTLQPITELSEDKRSFYNQCFDMTFMEEPAETFLSELKQQLEKRKEEKKPSNRTALQLLLLYHENDAALRDEVEKHLAALRIKGLEIWHEGKISPGTDINQIAQHLQTAQIIVPLVTADFMASDKLYKQHLQTALKRHQKGAAKVVPILMTPYHLEDTVFEYHNILLPKPRGKAINQNPNREEALAAITTDLRQIIERFKNPTKITPQ